MTILANNILKIDGQFYKVKSLGPEPTEPGYGYSIEPFEFEGQLKEQKDAAKAKIFPNSNTPPQYVEREGKITDYPLKGKGMLLCMRPEGKIEKINYDENKNEKNLKIEYGKGCYICWAAGEEGLEFIEICEPPYKPGDLKNLDIDSEDIPEEFRKAYKSLISSQSKSI